MANDREWDVVFEKIITIATTFTYDLMNTKMGSSKIFDPDLISKSIPYLKDSKPNDEFPNHHGLIWSLFGSKIRLDK